MTNRELDALISEKLFNSLVIGWYYVHYDYDNNIQVLTEKEYVEHKELQLFVSTNREPMVIEPLFCTPEHHKYEKEYPPYFNGHYDYCLVTCPKYSTDIADAWKILDKLQTEWEIEISKLLTDHTIWHVGFEKKDVRCVADEETLPLAIANAALITATYKDYIK